MKYPNTHPGVKLFIEDLRVLCKNNKVKLKLINKQYIDCDGSSISGYFDGDNMVLAVAVRKKVIDWIEIMIHESCHLDQCLENTKEWNDCTIRKVHDTYSLLDLWLNYGIEFTDKQLKNIINRIIKCERDCDNRAVTKIKQYGLQDIIDLDVYTQKCNAYHLSYCIVAKIRKWNKPMKAPYMNPKISKKFSKKMSSSFRIPPRMLNFIIKDCY